MRKLQFLKAFNSPFKRPRLQFYFGKTELGVPYFLPRKWINSTEKPGYKIPILKKVGFDFIGLGWKTKYDFYRFEWPPRISFVFFGLQLAVTVVIPESDHYWEAWLYYERDTDKTKSKKERIQQCMEEYPLKYKVSETGSKEWKEVNYYESILRKKYLKYINNEQTKTN